MATFRHPCTGALDGKCGPGAWGRGQRQGWVGVGLPGTGGGWWAGAELSQLNPHSSAGHCPGSSPCSPEAGGHTARHVPALCEHPCSPRSSPAIGKKVTCGKGQRPVGAGPRRPPHAALFQLPASPSSGPQNQTMRGKVRGCPGNWQWEVSSGLAPREGGRGGEEGPLSCCPPPIPSHQFPEASWTLLPCVPRDSK